MSFGKFMSAYMITFFIHQLAYSRLAFFKYDNPFFQGFSWLSFAKFSVDLTVFAGIFVGICWLIEQFPEWRMRVRYEKAQKEREKEQLLSCKNR